MEVPLPKGWRGIYPDQYNNTSNPDEHLAKYVTQVNMFNRVGLTLVHPTIHQLDRLIRDAKTEVQYTIFDQLCSPPHSRSPGQPMTGQK
ncbi:hypothetical protein CR513_20413, partial [Mucuna pruriens]